MKSSKIYVLETNLDDVTSEEASYLVDRLMAEGARDVHVLSCLMKKGRPGFLLRVLADDPERFSRLIMEESGSLGVRFMEWDRFEAERHVREVGIEVEGVRETVKVKESEFSSKPEFEDIARIAAKHKKTLREVLDLVRERI